MRALVVTEDLVEAAWKFTVQETVQEKAKAKAKAKVKAGARLNFQQKVKIVISVCLAIFFCTSVLLFISCAVEDSELSGRGSIPRRWRILQGLARKGLVSGRAGGEAAPPRPKSVTALHGMGVVFGGERRRRSMSELIVAHATEQVSNSELRIFVRTLYRSGALARADLVIIFPKSSSTEEAFEVIQQECDLGAKMLSWYLQSADDPCNKSSNPESFNAAAFREAAAEYSLKAKKRVDPGVAIGSIMAFEMEELDPDNILQGFIDEPPAQLRRWICYQLLLGTLRHKYRNILLARIGAVYILGDALASTRKNSSNIENNNNNNNNNNNAGLLLLLESRSWNVVSTADEFYAQDRVSPRRRLRKHKTLQKPQSRSPPRRNGNGNGNRMKMLVEAVYGTEVWNSFSVEDRQKRLISSGIIAGTMSPVRALANAMVNEIIRVSVNRRRHGEAFPDQVLLSYLVHVSTVLGHKVTNNLQLVDNGRQSTFAYSVAGTNMSLTEVLTDVGWGAIDGLSEQGRSALFSEMIRRDLCAIPDDANLYPDCITR